MKVSVCAVLLGFSCGVVLLLLSARQVLLGVLNCYLDILLFLNLLLNSNEFMILMHAHILIH